MLRIFFWQKGFVWKPLLTQKPQWSDNWKFKETLSFTLYSFLFPLLTYIPDFFDKIIWFVSKTFCPTCANYRKDIFMMKGSWTYSWSMKLGKNRHLLCIPPTSYATPTQKLVVQIFLPPNYFAAKIKSQIQPVLGWKLKYLPSNSKYWSGLFKFDANCSYN